MTGFVITLLIFAYVTRSFSLLPGCSWIRMGSWSSPDHNTALKKKMLYPPLGGKKAYKSYLPGRYDGPSQCTTNGTRPWAS